MNKFLDKTFGITKSGSTIKTEIIAGFTTFFAMCYIVLVNPAYITGGLAGAESMWNAIFIGGTIAAIVPPIKIAFHMLSVPGKPPVIYAGFTSTI